MDRYIAHANIDHYFNLLTSQALTDRNRATIMKLMIAEVEKFGRDLEHLQFVEVKTASARDRADYLSKLRNTSADGSAERAEAEKVLANFEAIHELMEQFCRHMRKKVNES